MRNQFVIRPTFEIHINVNVSGQKIAHFIRCLNIFWSDLSCRKLINKKKIVKKKIDRKNWQKKLANCGNSIIFEASSAMFFYMNPHHELRRSIPLQATTNEKQKTQHKIMWVADIDWYTLFKFVSFFFFSFFVLSHRPSAKSFGKRAKEK